MRRRSRSGPWDSERRLYVLMTTLLVTLRLGARPVPSRSSGTCATPARIASRGSPPRRTRPPTLMRPERGMRIPEIASASSRCPFPATPATPTISPSRIANETSETAVSPRSPDTVSPSTSSDTDVRELPRLLERTRHLDLATDHERREGAGRGAFGGDRVHRAPAPEDGDAIRDGENLVQLVRDEDDRLPLVRHRAQGGEERDGLLRREDGGRLVHDQDARLTVERLQDLDPLLLADRELPDPGARVDAEPVPLSELGDTALDRPAVDEERAPLRAVVSEDDVLGDGERRDEPEVLVHHADARVERVARRVEASLLAVQLDLAVVRTVEAGEDVRERRLPGAVLPEERVHLPDAGLEARRRRSRGRPESAS